MTTPTTFSASCVACAEFTARPVRMRDGALLCQACARFMRRALADLPEREPAQLPSVRDYLADLA